MISLHFLQPYLEPIATATLLINVYLAARANIFNFLFGAIGVSLYFLIFYQVKLYADMSLQLVYLSLQFYGCYQWLYGSAKHDALTISKANKNIWCITAIATIVLFFGLVYLLSHYTDSTTVQIDALTTALSLTAQWMMNKKYLENWWLWMVVDAISIKMYLFKGLYLTSGLYAVFFIICCMGYIHWQTQRKQLPLTPMATT
jgi:nicotinamide mononucleotide transporter